MGRPKKRWHIAIFPNKKVRKKWYQIWWYEGESRRYHEEHFQRKSDAEERIRQWESAEARETRRGPTLRAFAEKFFTDEERCPYLSWNPGLAEQTIYGHRHNLERIVERFGDYRIENITDYEFEQWLVRLRRMPKREDQSEKEMPLLANRTRNSIVETYKIVMKEAKKLRLIDHMPEVSRKSTQSRHRDAFTADEVKQLFPTEQVALHERWRLNKDDKSGYMFGLMVLVQMHGGMRPQEVRALQPFQVYSDKNTIYIVHQFDSQGNLAELKKATSDDKKKRFVRIPTATMKMLTDWIEFNRRNANDFVFTFDGSPVKKDYYRRRLQKVLARNKIDTEGRWITPYSFRYTFRSRVNGYVDLKSIMAMMGHTSEAVSEDYNQVDPEQFDVFELYQSKIDDMWRIADEQKRKD